jgi:hypothetical protein
MRDFEEPIASTQVITDKIQLIKYKLLFGVPSKNMSRHANGLIFEKSQVSLTDRYDGRTPPLCVSQLGVRPKIDNRGVFLLWRSCTNW